MVDIYKPDHNTDTQNRKDTLPDLYPLVFPGWQCEKDQGLILNAS